MKAPVVPGRQQTEPDMSMWDLVTRAQLGDRDAFGQLYSRYADVVFRYLLFRCQSREVAEDLTSETFLRALRRIESVSYQGRDVGAWFITIARNLNLDNLKSSRHRLELLSPRIGDELGAHIDDDTPETAALAAEVQVIVLRALQRMSDRGYPGTDEQRQCLELRFLVGLSVSETAEVMRRTVPAVKTLQYRAVKEMARMVEIRKLGEVR